MQRCYTMALPQDFFGRAAWCVDSGREVCRRGFILAVQDITIVCPEESLLLCSRVCQLCRKKIPCWGMTRRLRRGWWGYRPEGGSTFFRSERKYQRKHAARRLRRRPTSLRAVGFGLREPNGWTPRIYSGRPIPAVRPEQSDHVPWADCPQGLSSTLVRCAHPPEKGFDCPFCRRGSQCRSQWSWIAFTSSWSALVLAYFRRQNGRAFFPPLPIAALLPRRWRWADSNSGAWDASMRLGWLRSTEKQD